MSTGIVGIVLAAGQGRRFGSDKLMSVLPNGLPMAVAAVVKLRPACDHLIVVIRPDQIGLSQALANTDCDIVLCAQAEHGMGHSLAAGVNATPNADGWVVALADMPFVRSSSHAAVADALRQGASIAAPAFHGQRGHPVGFSRRWLTELRNLSGDEGARSLLRSHQNELVFCPVENEGVIRDIDHPDDLSMAKHLGNR